MVSAVVMRAWRAFLSSVNFTFIVNFFRAFSLSLIYLLYQNGKLLRWSKKKLKWRPKKKDEILESKLMAILSSILDAKLKTYEESMNFYNTKFETM